MSGLRELTDKRLLACASFVSGGGIVCDVGTDHAYLPCYLVKNGICKRAVAADVNPSPLAAAKENIQRAGLEDKIDTVLSNGLDGISPNGVTDVVIAGMGGELIADILGRGKAFYSARFILQPMTKPERLRRWLWENGFEIACERACKEEIYYTVMLVKYTGKNSAYTAAQCYIGALKGDSDDDKGYISKQAERLRKKGEGLMKSGSAQAQKYLQLAEKLDRYIKQG